MGQCFAAGSEEPPTLPPAGGDGSNPHANASNATGAGVALSEREDQELAKYNFANQSSILPALDMSQVVAGHPYPAAGGSGQQINMAQLGGQNWNQAQQGAQEMLGRVPEAPVTLPAGLPSPQQHFQVPSIPAPQATFQAAGNQAAQSFQAAGNQMTQSFQAAENNASHGAAQSFQAAGNSAFQGASGVAQGMDGFRAVPGPNGMVTYEATDEPQVTFDASRFSKQWCPNCEQDDEQLRLKANYLAKGGRIEQLL